ncbi:MAG: response regulator [Ferruginibacter sp.]|nr:response regulator [Ferruginibacter sp.]
MIKKTILTIEDSNALSFLMSTVLKKDFAVTSVKSCSDALYHLQDDLNKDLIILDIPDADSDNFELLEHISTSAVFSNIRTVVISNSDDETLKSKTVELGASLFLTKPFDPVFLSDKVRSLIYLDGKEGIRKRRTSFNLNIF